VQARRAPPGCLRKSCVFSLRSRRRRLSLSPVEIDPDAEAAQADAAAGAGKAAAALLCGGPPQAAKDTDF
jgi:hypothetical protein